MHMMKRVLALVLVLVLMTVLCACGNKAEILAARQAELCAGKWLARERDSQEQAQVLLEGIDLYPEEIALVDKTSLFYSVILEYSMNGTYRQYISVEHTKLDVRDFYQGVFEDLYENRSTLSGLYETDLGAMTREEFLVFYAGLYGFEDFSDLLDEFVECAYDYKWEDLESGTYTMKSVNLISIQRTTTDPEAEPTGTVSFQLENGTLTQQYSDGDVVYTNIG